MKPFPNLAGCLLGLAVILLGARVVWLNYQVSVLEANSSVAGQWVHWLSERETRIDFLVSQGSAEITTNKWQP